MTTPSKVETRYAYSGDVGIAYQVLGEGPMDVVMVPGFPSHLELAWEQPRLAHFYRRLASFCRLVLLDKRGLGLSDRVPASELPGLEQRMDDVRAVLEAVGSDSAALIGASAGGPISALFAATYPERVERLILINTYARRLRADDYPWATTTEQWESFQQTIKREWGRPVFVELLAPGMADDPAYAEWWASFLRHSVSPGAAVALLRMNAMIDVRSILDAIHVPTLVIHRTGDRIDPVEGGRFLAERIPDARLVEVEGDDHHPWLGNQEPILAEIEAFLTGSQQGPAPSQVLATLLFTNIVGSTDRVAELGDQRWGVLLETHDDVVRTQLGRFGGREANTTGDGFVAMFDGPENGVI